MNIGKVFGTVFKKGLEYNTNIYTTLPVCAGVKAFLKNLTLELKDGAIYTIVWMQWMNVIIVLWGGKKKIVALTDIICRVAIEYL